MFRALFAALSFLTILPVPTSWGGDGQGLRRSVWWFPVVGAFLGGIAVGVCYGLDRVLPPLAGGALIVCLLVVLSRGLHLDGLADTADGLLSCQPRDRALAIMRDSRTGAMGVIAVVLVLLLKVAFLGSLTIDGERLEAVFLMPFLGRCAILVAMGAFKYARQEEGLATALAVQGRIRLLLLLWATAASVGAAYGVAGLSGVVAAVACILFAGIFGLVCRRRLGGYTGDTLGATSEIAECIPLLVIALWQGA
ncbi:MAG: adenosylcobinamide-GDP ribazoletransferase [Thermoleophilia bacterium]|nr:adenosylcobinamide-GDP ribazoletransferase [Thermoleophilia bacterium]